MARARFAGRQGLSIRGYGAATMATALSVLSGCSDSLFSRDDAFDRRVALDRLRHVETRNFDGYKKAEATPPEVNTRTVRSRFEGLPEAALTIEECRASALTNNLDLKVAIVDPAISAQTLSREEAKFENTFVTRALWQETDSPTSSELSSAQSQFGQLEPSVRIPLRTGGTASVALPMSRSKNNNPFTTLNPAYESDLEFSISQPLLRGAGVRANQASIRIASYNQQADEARTKLEVIRQLAAVDRAYWQLFEARRALEVTQQQYELAQAQLQRADRRVNAGQVGEIEVTRAQAGLSERLDAIIQAQNLLLQRERELKRIMNMPDLPIDSSTLVTTATQPDPVEYVITRDDVVKSALSNRMELLELELLLASDAASIDLAHNAALPLFTLDYTYRVNGLGSTAKESMRVASENNFEDWSLGLTAEIPLGNEAARSQIREAILRRIQRLATKEARTLAIRQEVLDAVDNIEQNWQRILAARQSVILNTRLLQAEQRQFDVGASTSTDVLDAATSLAQSQLDELRALTAYQIAQVDLAFATGTLLGAGKIDWTPAPAPDYNGPRPKEEVPQ
ncbi:MAG TPA: TolC family protein [Phycisphaerales bacterium]|nr:TolC family protein [Phycisphaerales bacterium]